MTLQFTTITEVRAHKWVGNHHDDSTAFRAVEAFVRSDAPLAERAEAIRVSSLKGMGIQEMQTDDAKLVAVWLDLDT